MKLLRDTIIDGFHRDQKGSAMTEFVMFLPIWLTVFIGVVALGTIGVETTKVQMSAQKKVWDMAIDSTTSGLGPDLATPVGGGGIAGAKAAELGRGIGDGAEAIVNITGLAIGGHWGESYERVVLLDAVFDTGIEDLSYLATGVIGDDAKYPRYIVDDSAAGIKNAASGDDTSIGKLLASFFAATGYVAAAGAGIRYGMAHGIDTQTFNVAGGRSISAKFHYDMLVSPSPLTGTLGKRAPIAIARLMAESEDNYNVMMNFGESEWEGSGSNSGSNNLGINTDFGTGGAKEPADNKDKIAKEKKKCTDNGGTIVGENCVMPPPPPPPNP
ncbi:MAG: hypothetical protein H0U74_21535 [Bradymonadaceae bacterium]|nr:hypothetical protein [Lujinxingiaceae bacterium]